MIQRIIRAVRFDPSLYRQLAAERGLTGEAALIALVVALLEGAGFGIAAKNAPVGFLAGFAVSFLIGWLLWAVISAAIANRFGEHCRPGDMARPLAFAGLPRLLALFGFIPCVGWLFRAAGWILALIFGAAALRAMLDLDKPRAMVASLVGLFLYYLASIAVGWFTNGFGLFGM